MQLAGLMRVSLTPCVLGSHTDHSITAQHGAAKVSFGCASLDMLMACRLLTDTEVPSLVLVVQSDGGDLVQGPSAERSEGGD